VRRPPGIGHSRQKQDLHDAQHLLSYVQIASESTGFEITSYSGSPSAWLFRLPAGTKITSTKITSAKVTSAQLVGG
jgi:hypothetical protein